MPLISSYVIGTVYEWYSRHVWPKQMNIGDDDNDTSHGSMSHHFYKACEKRVCFQRLARHYNAAQ